MPTYIVKLTDKDTKQDYYLLWSTIVDAPVSDGVPLEKFRDVLKASRGGDEGYEARMARVHEKGVSALDYANVEELISHNRAGHNETPLTYDEIVQVYCRKEPITTTKDTQ